VLDKWLPDGHFGMHALRDLVHDAGGRLDLLAAADGGTTVRVKLRR
jgi:signal transduction histidine kinase